MQIVKIVAGLAITLAFKEGLKLVIPQTQAVLYHFVRYFLTALAASFLVPWLFKITRLGGKENARYYKLSVSVLIHWGTTQREAAKKAQEVFELFYGVTNMKIKDSSVAFFAASAQQWLGFTEDKICEYVIPIEIYVNKEE